MKIIDLKCPRCGATLKTSDDKKEAYCEFCDYKCLLEKEKTQEEIIEEARNEGYARVEGEKLAEEEHNKRIKRRDTKIKFITILIAIGAILGTVSINNILKEKMEDPFQYVNVKFSGATGRGRADLEIHDIESDEVKFSLSKKDKLIEDEEITIFAQSSKYKLGTHEKKIKVSGLDIYVTDLNMLDSKMIDELHKSSKDYLKSHIEDGYSFKGTIEELEPYHTYLLTDKKEQSYLYDVYKIKIKTPKNNLYDRFVVCKYSSTIISSQNKNIHYSEMKVIGKSVKVGGEVNSGDYAGSMTGFLRIEDFENFVKQNEDASLELYK